MEASRGAGAKRRSVSLYWVEKLWLLLDGLQLLAVLLYAMQASLPYGWNAWARYTLIFLLDIPGLLRPLAASNISGPYPLDATMRAFVLLFVLLSAFAAAACWPRAVYALELYERRQELEKIKKEQELQKLRRASQARPSVTTMLALAMNPAAPSLASRCRNAAKKTWAAALVTLYYLLGKATRLRAALTLFLVPALLAIELPLIFCSDQADACNSLGLLAVRTVSFAALVCFFVYSVRILLLDVKEGAVARQGKQQEEHLKQREIEYLLFINKAWMDKKVWLVSSFKGGVFCTYFRLWILLLKAALLMSSSLLGLKLTENHTGLGWVVYAKLRKDPAAAATLAAQAAEASLGGAIAAEPLGNAARTAAAAALVLCFCLFAIVFPPFRCKSSNFMHLLLFVHLGGISGLGLAATGSSAQKNSYLLYSNQHQLLAVVHLLSCCILLAIAGFCCIKCFVPVESPVLQRYELMMGYDGSNSSKGADGRGTVPAFLHNIGLVLRDTWRSCKSCFGGDGSGSGYSSWSSSSTLEIGETEIREKDYRLRPFEAPWPTRPQHARFWIRVAPQLVGQLAASSLLLERYAAAEKQLLPLHLANEAFKELVLLVAHHIGAVEQWEPRRRSRAQSKRQREASEADALEKLMRELAGNTPAANEYKQQASVEQKGEQTDGLGFTQHQSNESLWSVDSAAAAAAAALPHALAFRQLERAAHLSAEFPNANLAELQELRSFIKAVEWTIAEVFEKMSAIRAAAAAESIWRAGSAPPMETQKLLRDFAVHLKRRQRQNVLMQPVRKRILLKLLAVRFMTDTKQQREKREKEKKQQMADLFGEESSILFFSPDG
ncbi:hypothetical protein ACSSS7_005259 [Eimeria intestinalis]